MTSLIQYILGELLSRPEEDVTAVTSAAALVLLIYSEPQDRGALKSRESLIRHWADKVRHPPTSRTGSGVGFFFALTMAYPILGHLPGGTSQDNALICSAILDRWATDKKTETRVSLLQALTQGGFLRHNVHQYLDLLAEGLDDYTTTARGDVGSHVRLQAVRATKSLWESIGGAGLPEEVLQATVSRLFLRVLRLAAEKLDRVRVEAQAALALTLQERWVVFRIPSPSCGS